MDINLIIIYDPLNRGKSIASRKYGIYIWDLYETWRKEQTFFGGGLIYEAIQLA